MSRQKILLVVFVLPIFLIAMFSLGLYMKAKGFGTVPGPSILPPQTLGVSDGPTVLLVKESGVVTYKLPESAELLTMEEDEIGIPTGTTVKTGADSLAHVVFPDNSLMSLSKDTEVVINFEDKKIKIFQLLGNTWHRVEKILQGHSYEVETPNTLATVRGTEFNVGVLPNNESEVYVMESVVDVSKIVKENDEVVIKETVKVEKDKHIFVPPVDATEPMKLVPLPPNKKNTDWFKRNSKLTEKIKEAEENEEKKRNENVNDESGVTPPITPEMMDNIRQNVRKDLMNKIKEDPDLKKIDDVFRLEKPSATPTSTVGKTKEKDTRTENKKDSTGVLGESTNKIRELLPTVTPTQEQVRPTTPPTPTSSPKAEPTPIRTGGTSTESTNLNLKPLLNETGNIIDTVVR